MASLSNGWFPLSVEGVGGNVPSGATPMANEGPEQLQGPGQVLGSKLPTGDGGWGESRKAKVVRRPGGLH